MRRGRGAGGEGRGAWGEGRGAGGGREGEGERVPPYAPQPQEPSPSLLGRAALEFPIRLPRKREGGAREGSGGGRVGGGRGELHRRGTLGAVPAEARVGARGARGERQHPRDGGGGLPRGLLRRHLALRRLPPPSPPVAAPSVALRATPPHPSHGAASPPKVTVVTTLPPGQSSGGGGRGRQLAPRFIACRRPQQRLFSCRVVPCRAASCWVVPYCAAGISPPGAPFKGAQSAFRTLGHAPCGGGSCHVSCRRLGPVGRPAGGSDCGMGARGGAGARLKKGV